MPLERNYSNKPSRRTLAAGIDASQTTLTITGTAPLVSDLLPPYTAVLDRGEATEEVVLVTAETGTGTVTMTLVRGYADTTAASHASGSSFEHCMVASDLRASNAPYYAGDRRNPFDAETSFYNVTDTSMQRMRTFLAKAATQRVRVNFVGHSIFAGSFTSQIGSYDIASQTRRFLSSEGVNVNGSGFTLISNNPGANPALGRDYRWTSITGWTPQNNVSFPWASTSTNGAAAIFQSDAPGTIVDVGTFDMTGTIQIYVDDVLKDTYTGPNAGGTGTTQIVRSITGLPNTKHKVEIRTTTTTLAAISGARVRNATGLEVSNFGNGGSTSVNWTPSGQYHQNYKVMQGVAPGDIFFVGLDGNEIFQSFTAETYRSSMQGVLNGLVGTGAAVVLVPAPVMSPATGYPGAPIPEATWDAFLEVEYDLADQYDIPMLDTRHLFVSYTAANTATWMGDTIHPNDTGHAVIARSLAVEMLKTIPYDTKPEATLEEYESIPSAPTTGLKFFTKYGARRIPAFVATGGQWSALQPGLFANRISWLTAINNATTPSVWGMATPTVSGTASAVDVANTNFYTGVVKYRIASTALAGNAAGIRTTAQWFTSSTANSGGFFFVARFGFGAITATNRIFVGLTSDTALLSNGDPTAKLNLFGFGANSAHTNLQFMHNDGSGTATTVDLGTNFPAQTGATHFFETRLYAAPGAGNVVNWCIIRLTDGVQRQGSATTDLPAVGTKLAAHIWHNNGTTAAAVNVDIQSLYIETDN